jgi:hypothetical protein
LVTSADADAAKRSPPSPVSVISRDCDVPIFVVAADEDDEMLEMQILLRQSVSIRHPLHYQRLLPASCFPTSHNFVMIPGCKISITTTQTYLLTLTTDRI